MPQLNIGNVRATYQVDPTINIHTSITVPANASRVVNIPSTYSLSKRPQDITVSIKYEDNQVYKDASLFATADINNNDTITVYNDSNSEHILYLSISG